MLRNLIAYYSAHVFGSGQAKPLPYRLAAPPLVMHFKEHSYCIKLDLDSPICLTGVGIKTILLDNEKTKRFDESHYRYQQ